MLGRWLDFMILKVPLQRRQFYDSNSSGALSSRRPATLQDNTERGSKSEVTFHSAREASPVSEDHQREPFSVEVIDSLRSLKGRVREPHLASLLDDLLGIKKTGKP